MFKSPVALAGVAFARSDDRDQKAGTIHHRGSNVGGEELWLVAAILKRLSINSGGGGTIPNLSPAGIPRFRHTLRADHGLQARDRACPGQHSSSSFLIPFLSCWWLGFGIRTESFPARALYPAAAAFAALDAGVSPVVRGISSVAGEVSAAVRECCPVIFADVPAVAEPSPMAEADSPVIEQSSRAVAAVSATAGKTSRSSRQTPRPLRRPPQSSRQSPRPFRNHAKTPVNPQNRLKAHAQIPIHAQG
jgi:hypothetical protein